ncbi:glycosyltransferase family 2 protein [Flavicella sp.]|uniref:glycosyltransferase family 2 protein n=1 Tax=Flavicella sp. TaxID=2957742 RepID=UPI003019E550
MNSNEISVIISTYNAEQWLLKALLGYNEQTFRNFELVIADDGSTKKTKILIENFRKKSRYPIVHVWQDDNGFQKSQILNKAVKASTTPYIIMSDGDCIPRNTFVERHNKYKEKGYFLSGGYFMLPSNISNKINPEHISSQVCFNLDWLKDNGLKDSMKNNKLKKNKKLSKFLNFFTPTKATWNGHNSSGWKKDILAVNGFDERMQYGGQDRELGERLKNLGIQSKQIRYSAIVIHLDHPRAYVNDDSWKKNDAIRKVTRTSKTTTTLYGIRNE